MSSDEGKTPKFSAEMAVHATTTLVAGAVGIGHPEAGLLLAMAKDFTDPVLEGFVEKLKIQYEERARTALAFAANEAGLTASGFMLSIDSDHRKMTLTAQTIQAATQTPLEQKIIALGRSLGRGVRDETLVDAEMLRIRGLAGIETWEVQLMEVLSAGPPVPQSSRIEDQRLPGWTRSDILSVRSGFAAAVDASVARLTREGMARDASIGGFGGGEPRWILTEFGQECLCLLRTVPSPA
ncbi:hypothetical protein [Streptomyces sp. NBC_01217]|uniref:hypothetical protein n=1 Tax=Streptomyces sp. NBC_01217 TaxID=2903779 RepID=UPI002E11E4B1|nr:hypothetical protein OG507_20665 [Streptomyces sp. NBC_01217]